MNMYIYGLCDPRDGRLRYVGVAKDPQKRLADHLNDKKVCHKASWIQSLRWASLKPEMIVIEVVNETNWQKREKFWIQYYHKMTKLTNMTDGGEGILGKHHSPESREKMRLAHIGKHLSDEQRTKISETMTGRHHSLEMRAKMRVAMTGKKPFSFGKHLSSAHRAALSIAQIGKHHSPETCAKISAAKIGNKNHLGKNHSLETREKMRVKRKEWWARKKNG